MASENAMAELCRKRCLKDNAKTLPDDHRETGHRRCKDAIRTIDEKREMSKPKTERYASVWDAIADTPEEAANLRVRAELMEKITAIIEASSWTQAEAAEHCGVTQPRINDLLRGRISRFSLDALVNIASALGKRVQVKLMAA